VDGFAIQLQTRTPDYLIDISLDAGIELIALLGRRGSGKTVILRAIAGVYEPQFGIIELGDRMVFSTVQNINIPPSDRRVGWIPNASALFPAQSVYDNVAFALQKQDSMPEPALRQRVLEVLEMLRLGSLQNQLPSTLSDEELQRVCFARALVIDPDILLLDNPFDGLDVATRRKVRQKFMSLREAVAVPALIATDDLEEAYEMASRIALIERGRILQYDRPRTIVMRPVSRQVAQLTLSVNIGQGMVVEAVEGGVMVQTRLGRLRAAGIYSLGLEVDTVIRPEHIQVLRPDDDEYSDNVLPGTLLDARRNGELYDLRFAPDTGGEPIQISVSDLAFRELRIQPPQPCRVHFPPQALHLMALLPDNESPSGLETDEN
jgi:ABC-type Fe3+/spermidine/putrescine transport system ATPase subunit